jgi:hypothetical protein
MRGMQVKTWATNYDTEENAAKKPRESWQSEIIVLIIKELNEIVKERNAEIHGKNTEK